MSDKAEAQWYLIIKTSIYCYYTYIIITYYTVAATHSGSWPPTRKYDVIITIIKSKKSKISVAMYLRLSHNPLKLLICTPILLTTVHILPFLV